MTTLLLLTLLLRSLTVPVMNNSLVLRLDRAIFQSLYYRVATIISISSLLALVIANVVNSLLLRYSVVNVLSLLNLLVV